MCFGSSHQTVLDLSWFLAMTEAVQEQEFEFWDMWKRSQKSSMDTDGSTAADTENQAREDSSGQHPDAPPSKYPKPSSKGSGQQGGRGKGKREGGRNEEQSQNWGDKANWQWHSSGGSSGGRIAALESQVRNLTRLALRHEDAIGLLRSEFSFVIHAKVDAPTSVVKTMFSMQQDWRTLKEKEPSKLTGPLRVALLGCLFRELQERLDKLLQDEQMSKTWVDMEWLTRDLGFFPYLRYNQETRRLEPEKTRPGLPVSILREHIAEVAKNIPAPGALARYHPIRPLTANMAGESLVFLLQTGVGSDAAQSLSLHLKALVGHSVTQLCAFTLQADRLQRSGLANQLSKSLQDQYSR